MRESTLTKLDKLREILRGMDSVLVAYSGGVDSTFLLKMAYDVLGPNNAHAFIVSSQVYPEWETAEAHCTAEKIGASVIDLNQDILLIPAYKENPDDRCYHCKREMLSAAVSNAKSRGIKYVLEGTNADEAAGWRPGLKAIEESGARSPLLEAGFTKDEIREASKELGLPTWDKPSMACLSSRFPHGVEITPERLKQIATCEMALRNAGFKQVRVRFHGNLARIEISPHEFPQMIKDGVREKILDEFKKSGFKFVSLDLAGYKTGSMNPEEATGDRPQATGEKQDV